MSNRGYRRLEREVEELGTANLSLKNQVADAERNIRRLEAGRRGTIVLTQSRKA